MPAKSKAQQKFMGLVHAYKKGDIPASKVNKSVKDAAKSMSTKDIKDFANTDRKGLPNKVSKKEFINKFTELLDAEMESCGYVFSAKDPSYKLKSPGGTGEEDKKLKEKKDWGDTTINYKKDTPRSLKKSRFKQLDALVPKGRVNWVINTLKKEIRGIKINHEEVDSYTKDGLILSKFKKDDINKILAIVDHSGGLFESKKIMNEINSYKQFVKYMNDFYGPKGVYPDKKKRTLKMKDIGLAYSVLLKKKPDFEIGYDSTDREMLRDILIKLRKLDPDYSQKESISEDVYIGYYKNKKVKVTAKSSKEAQRQIAKKLRVPKKDYDIASIQNLTKTKQNKHKFEYSGMSKWQRDRLDQLSKEKGKKPKKVSRAVKKKQDAWAKKYYTKGGGINIAKWKKDGSPGFPKESVNEVERDYKAEYRKFQSSTKAKKYRAELNKYNRKKGTYGNGDGKDASHKGGKIVGFEAQSKNRGRAEKSRLKKESVIGEDVFAIVDKFNQRKQDYDQVYYKDNNLNKVKKHMKKMGKKYGKMNLIKVKPNGKMSMVEEVTKGKGVQKIFDIHKNGYGKLGGRMLDSLSAGLFVQLYDKAPDNIKEKMNKMNEKRLYIVIGKMWDKFGKGVKLS